MHDLFDIVGLSRSARPVEVRRACARLTRRAHPDFHAGSGARRPPQSHSYPPVSPRLRREVAVDFVDIASVLDRIQAAFFGRIR